MDEEKSNAVVRRWNRADDKKLFQVIRDLEAKGLLSLHQLLQIKITRASFRNKLLKKIAEQLDWRETSKLLLARIQKLSKMEFTTREVKLLKRMIKKNYAYKNLDYEAIFYHFPGKTMQELIEVSDKICKIKTQKKLCSLMELKRTQKH